MKMTTGTSKLLQDIMSSQNNVPINFIRPISDRPNLAVVETSSDAPIPLIDLQALAGPDHSQLIRDIGLACQKDGFFQVKNHGIPSSLITKLLLFAREFFWLPESERMKCYSDNPLKATRLSTSFNVNTEHISNWRDFLRIHCHPVEDFVDEWPSNPSTFRPVVSEYCKMVRELALNLLKIISESLGRKEDHIEKVLGKHEQHMAINYYPQCPQPELTYGLPGHKDPNAITILLQDAVSGLQIFRNGKWVTVPPLPDTFIINIGDQVELLSNGRYKSVLHRAIVNSNSDRISIPTFYSPSQDAIIEPAKLLVDEDHPAMYRSIKYGEYYDKFWNGGLQSESWLNTFKNAS